MLPEWTSPHVTVGMRVAEPALLILQLILVPTTLKWSPIFNE